MFKRLWWWFIVSAVQSQNDGICRQPPVCIVHAFNCLFCLPSRSLVHSTFDICSDAFQWNVPFAFCLLSFGFLGFLSACRSDAGCTEFAVAIANLMHHHMMKPKFEQRMLVLRQLYGYSWSKNHICAKWTSPQFVAALLHFVDGIFSEACMACIHGHKASGGRLNKTSHFRGRRNNLTIISLARHRFMWCVSWAFVHTGNNRSDKSR